MDRDFVEKMCCRLKDSALSLAVELSLSSHAPHLPGSLNAVMGFLDKLEGTLEEGNRKENAENLKIVT